ncbi:hypothetical protein GOBAR_AA32425 [Gossypium barbadense]|uniref:CASP-like protein n=1 Tax=Gossypium barbadense TaxID=3634 RepID=A0A2P5WB40_GOSBA|nr:hypothetical protein GOBAR_AA32425 [Gossypium barbadense]
MSYLGVGVSPGNVPVYHGTNLKVIDRRVRVAELVLRCLICGLSVLAAVLVGTDTQIKEIFTIQKRARFTDMKALVFLVAANGITAAYSLVQGVRCVVGMGRGSVLFSKPLALAIFSGDQKNENPRFRQQQQQYDESSSILQNYPHIQNWLTGSFNQKEIVFLLFSCWLRKEKDYELYAYQLKKRALAYLNLAAVGAAAQSAAFAKLGQTKLQWMVICNMYGKFCNQVGEGIAVSLLVSICMVGLSCISAFGLFRLYGSNKAKNNSGW